MPRGKVRLGDKLQFKAATILPLVGLARSKQDPMNRGRQRINAGSPRVHSMCLH